jgi:hypothetical protein
MPAKEIEMTTSPNLVGLYVGLFFGGCFLGFTFIKYRKIPEFLEIAVIILSCTGTIIGIHLGYVTLTIQDSELGQLSEYRVPVVLGALSVVWTSIGSLHKTCKQSIVSIKS